MMAGFVLFAACAPAPSPPRPPRLEYGHEEGWPMAAHTGEGLCPGVRATTSTGTGAVDGSRSFRLQDGEVTDPQDWTADLAGIGQPNAFGQDAEGEMYAAHHEGEVRAIVAVL